MKSPAAVMHEVGRPLTVETIDVDEPRGGEVLVRVAAAGVCHSDLHYMKGDWPWPLPAVLGHEGAGVVVAVGPGVSRVKAGDSCILIFRPNCGACEYCQQGRPMLCQGHVRPAGTMYDGTTRMSLGGAPLYGLAGVACFSQYTVMSEEQLLPIDPTIPLDRAALVGCSVMTGVGAAVNTARVEPGSAVAVIGCGGVGLNVIQGARLQNAGRIIAVDLSDEKLELATRFGATDVVNAAEEDAVARIRELTGGGADCAFDAIGYTRTTEQAFDATRIGGKAVVVGIAPKGDLARIDAWSLVMQEKALLGSFYGSARPRVDMPRILDLYRQGRLMLDELVARTYPLERINEAYADLQSGAAGRGVIVFE